MLDTTVFKRHVHSNEPGWIEVYIDSPFFILTTIKFCGIQCGEYIYESSHIEGEFVYKNGKYMNKHGTEYHIFDVL